MAVTIVINGDVKNFVNKLKEVKKETKDVNEFLSKLAVGTVAGFGLATAGIVKATQAFKQAKLPMLELETSMKNQGIYSKQLFDSYTQQAKAIGALVNADESVLKSGLANLQSMIGQKKITEELTMAIVDFAAANKKDLNEAFKEVGEAIGTTKGNLDKYNISFHEGNTIQERMAIFLEASNNKYKGQAKAISDVLGPQAEFNKNNKELITLMGENFEPIFDGAIKTLASFTGMIKDSEGAVLALSSVAIGLTSALAIGAVVVVATKAIIAFEAAVLALGLTVGVATGGLTLLTGAIAAIGYVALTSGKKVDDLESLTRKLADTQKELASYERRDPNRLVYAGEINSAKQRIKSYESQIQKLKEIKDQEEKLTDTQKKQGAVSKSLYETGKLRDEQRKKREKELEELRKAEDEYTKHLLKLRNDLIEEYRTFGMTELQILEDQYAKKIKLAENDAELRSKIESDFQTKKFQLERDNNDKLVELRKAQADYEESLIAKREANLAKGSGAPLTSLANLDKEDPENRGQVATGAVAGALNNVSQGASGAKALVVEGAGMAVDAMIPGLGSALKPLLGALTDGPEATKAFVKEFIDAVPLLIEGLIESIPVLIEELANGIPVIIDKLIEKVPDIVSALVQALPSVITALVSVGPKLMSSIIQNIPMLINEFIRGLINGAGQFVNALINSINPFSDDGPLGFLGFAEGGQGIKKVPSGFPNDRFPAMLTSGEFVVRNDLTEKLEDALDDGGIGNEVSGAEINILSQILDELKIFNANSTNDEAMPDDQFNDLFRLMRKISKF